MKIRAWLKALFHEPELDRSLSDPMPYLAPDGCRFPGPDVRDSNFEHAGLEYSPRWRIT